MFKVILKTARDISVSLNCNFMVKKKKGLKAETDESNPKSFKVVEDFIKLEAEEKQLRGRWSITAFLLTNFHLAPIIEC